MIALAPLNGQGHKKALGTVWVNCQCVAPSLGEALEAAAEAVKRIDGEQRPPKAETPSTIVFCADEREDVVTELRRLRALSPDVPVLVLGPSTDLSLARTALEEGTSGYVHHDVRPKQLVRALLLASEGEVVVPKELLRRLVEEEAMTVLPTLTPQQLEILGLAAKGQSDAQIARRLSLPEDAVERHLSAVYGTLRYGRRLKEARPL